LDPVYARHEPDGSEEEGEQNPFYVPPEIYLKNLFSPQRGPSAGT